MQRISGELGRIEGVAMHINLGFKKKLIRIIELFFIYYVKQKSIRTMKRPYRKHRIITSNNHLTVKDWMRQNPVSFKDIKGVPTSEQIGIVLKDLGYNREDTYSSVIYRI